jgi:hypothetical protein
MTADERITQLEKAHPQARKLATLVALAVRVDPGYLRAIRLRFFPMAGTDAELALWFSPLVKAKGYDGIVFHSDVSDALRAELLLDAALFRDVWACTEELHAGFVSS